MRTQQRSLAFACSAVFAGAAGLVQPGVARGQSDECRDATIIDVGTFAGDTNSAANDGAVSCGNSVTSPNVWYSFTPGEDRLLQVETCGSAYDTVLSIHAGNEAQTAVELLALHLVSWEPMTVVIDGPDTLWDVEVLLLDVAAAG